MDVEVIIKRTVVYAAAIMAIAAIYAVLLKLAGEFFLGGTGQHNTIIAVLATLVVVLLAPIVKNTIQMALDRAYYRDRYDYRQALVGFARDLNSDLDLQRLSERLVGPRRRDARARSHVPDARAARRRRAAAGTCRRSRWASRRCCRRSRPNPASAIGCEAGRR